MSKLDELLEELCPDGVEYKSIGDIGEVRMCKRILKEQTTDVGEIPFYKIGTFGKEPNAYISRRLFQEYKAKYSYPSIGDILISASGTIGRTVIFNGEDAYFQDSNIVWIEHDESNVLNKYLFYFYQIVKWGVAEGGTIRRLYNENLKKTIIPLPPLPIQEEIVRILDTFTELTAELTARKKQYEHYRDELLTFGDKVEWKILGDVLKIKNGKDYKQFDEGDIPVYGSGGIMTHIDTYALDKPSVLIPRKGSIDKLYYVDIPFWTVDTIFYTDIYTDIVIPKFVFYYLQKEHLEQYNTAGGVPSLTQSVLNKIRFPVLPLAKQQRIVDILDRFDTLCNDKSNGLPAEIKMRQQQYEFYRDKLLSFKALEL